MFNRLFLIITCIVSFIWISYVAFDLLDQRDKVTPQNIFNNMDGEILVINRPHEVRLDELEFKVHDQMRPVLDKLLSAAYLNERFYISQQRPILIVEISTIWDAETLRSFCSSKGFSLEKNGSGNTTDLSDLAFENGFSGRCERNFLLISTAHIHGGNHGIAWPIWDQKASASIIQLNQPFKSTDVYFKEDGTIAYQTKYNAESDSRKIDDKDLFAQVLPDKLTKYHFYERNYAKSIHLLSAESPLYLWAESGYVTFEYRGEPCLISDYIGGQDPFTVIREKLAESDEVIDDNNKGSQLFQYIQVTSSFPADASNGFYMMYIADKVVLSASEETCRQIVADYQLGKTVALNKAVSDRFYGKLPQKVSERYITTRESYSKSAYRNILIKTVVAHTAIEQPAVGGEKQRAEKSWTQSVNGQNTILLGRSGTQFIWTSAHEMIAVSNRKKTAQLKLEGTLIGQPVLIDLLDNGTQQVLFNTESHLYLVDASGNAHEGFPVKLDNAATNQISYYRWKGVGNFLIVDNKNRLIHFDNRGRELNILQLGVQNCINAVDVFNQKGVLTAVVSGSDRTQTVNMDKHRVLKKHPAIPQDRIVVKSPEGPQYYYFDEDSWIRQDYAGNAIKLGNYANATQFRLAEGADFRYLAFRSYNKLHIFNERGVKISQIDIPFRELASYDILTLENGKTYIALVDDLENNVYLYDNSGKSFTPKPLEGQELVLLSESNKYGLVLTTSGNNFIVQYFETLKQRE